MDKKQIRADVRGRLKAMDACSKELSSHQICTRVAALPQIVVADTVAVFVSLPDEPQTAELISTLRAGGHRVVAPRVDGDSMEFYDVASGMRTGAFGISEPQGSIAIAASEIDAMIVPAVSFTMSGERLGRGRGYYDRYISRAECHAYTVGVCYACQISNVLPVEPHDRKVDVVITA